MHARTENNTIGQEVKPCKHGHTSERHPKFKYCLECHKIAGKASRARYLSGEIQNILPCKYGHTSGRFVDGRCKQCCKNQSVRYNTTPTVRRRKSAKRQGLNIEQVPLPPLYCECCGERPTGPKGLVCDHDHVTGIFRGWVCIGCNLGWKLVDNPVLLRRRANYLEGKK